ncbi:hypothetical protein [Saccharothrix sp. HUAS TT1]|uniref:hypothetical protein n=1 Tax=unclassified Saccharothrix TaxID=2593673 RepID=UPI00345C5E41
MALRLRGGYLVRPPDVQAVAVVNPFVAVLLIIGSLAVIGIIAFWWYAVAVAKVGIIKVLNKAIKDRNLLILDIEAECELGGDDVFLNNIKAKILEFRKKENKA